MPLMTAVTTLFIFCYWRTVNYQETKHQQYANDSTCLLIFKYYVIFCASSSGDLVGNVLLFIITECKCLYFFCPLLSVYQGCQTCLYFLPNFFLILSLFTVLLQVLYRIRSCTGCTFLQPHRMVLAILAILSSLFTLVKSTPFSCAKYH